MTIIDGPEVRGAVVATAPPLRADRSAARRSLRLVPPLEADWSLRELIEHHHAGRINDGTG
jgi:hypothetical protein